MVGGGTIRLGLIGAGPWGRNFIRTIQGMKGVDLIRLASNNPQSRDLVGPGCSITPDWREVAGADDLDGVIIATPPALHAEMTRFAIAKGLAALVEKPLTMNLEQAESLLEFAEARNAQVMVDHIHLYNPVWPVLKREAERLGPVRAIEAEAGRWGPFRAEAPVLWDWGPHDVSMCLDLIGRLPKNVEARTLQTRATPEGNGEVLELKLEFGGDVTARITLGNLFSEKKRSFAVKFDSALLTFDDTGPEKLIRRVPSKGAPEPVSVPSGSPLSSAVRTFAEGISSNNLGTDSLRLGVEVVEVLTRCSAALNR